MPRPKNEEEHVRWTLWLPASLAYKIEVILYDHFHGRIRHGARKELLIAHFEEWLSKLQGGGKVVALEQQMKTIIEDPQYTESEKISKLSEVIHASLHHFGAQKMANEFLHYMRSIGY